MAYVALHGLFREEEALADLAVDQPFGDQLENLDLACGRLLLELPEGRCERNHLGVAVPPLRCHLVEATRVVHVAGQDLFALCSVHDSPAIGAPRMPL